MQQVHQIKVDIQQVPFQREGLDTLLQTAKVSFHDSYGKLLYYRQYGVIDKKQVYEWIHTGKPVSLDQLYVDDLSLEEYRATYHLNKSVPVSLPDFSAKQAFFNAQFQTDLTYAVFMGKQVSFEGAVFSNGQLSLEHVQFQGGAVSFDRVLFDSRQSSFEFVQFGEGNISFENALATGGNMLFGHANFGNGKASFRDMDFGDGDVDFQYAIFKHGNILFERCQFNGSKVDFSKVKFGRGTLNFRGCNFETPEVNFEESECEKGRVDFKRAKFGQEGVSFEHIAFEQCDMVFDLARFGSGSASFRNATIQKLSMQSCIFENYLDLRVRSCQTVNLSEAVVKNIINFKTGYDTQSIQHLYLTGLLNFGRIFIDWKQNHVANLIENQAKTTSQQKADQFRLLKEDFRNNGLYDDEDKAYVQFKRFEMKAEREAWLKANPRHALWVYPYHGAKWLLFDLVGLYATDPVRVLISMLMVYLLFSLSYIVIPWFTDASIVSSLGDPEKLPYFAVSFYHSAITFLTIGYGDYYPSGIIRWISNVEGFCGLFMMSYFTVAFVRKILR